MNLTHCWSGVNLLVTKFTTWLATMPASTEEDASLREFPSLRKLFRYLEKKVSQDEARACLIFTVKLIASDHFCQINRSD